MKTKPVQWYIKVLTKCLNKNPKQLYQSINCMFFRTEPEQEYALSSCNSDSFQVSCWLLRLGWDCIRKQSTEQSFIVVISGNDTVGLWKTRCICSGWGTYHLLRSNNPHGLLNSSGRVKNKYSKEGISTSGLSSNGFSHFSLLCNQTNQYRLFFQCKEWKTKVIWIQVLLHGYTRVVQPQDLLLALAQDTCSSLQRMVARAVFQHCRLVSLGEDTQQRKRWFRPEMGLWLSDLLEELLPYTPEETDFPCLDFTAINAPLGPQAGCTLSLRP